MPDDLNSGRHRFDPSALIAGLFFLAIAVTHLLAALGHGLRVSGAVLGPITLGGLAVVVVVRLATRRLRRDQR